MIYTVDIALVPVRCWSELTVLVKQVTKGAKLLQVCTALAVALVRNSGAFRADERDALRTALHAALVQNVSSKAPKSSLGLPVATLVGAAASAERSAGRCLVILATGNFPPTFKVQCPLQHLYLRMT